MNVCLAITHRCNLKCKHCCSDVDVDSKELSFEYIEDLALQFSKAKIFQVQIFGGEPLLRKDLFKIIKTFKDRKIRIAMNTNCTLIDDKVIAELKKVWPIDLFTSIDGSSAKTHDKLRGKGSFERTVEGITRLNRAGLKLGAETVITKYNLHDLVETAALAKKIGLESLAIVPVFLGGKAKCFQKDLSPNEEDYRKGNAIAKELLEKFPNFARGAFIDGYKKIQKFKSLKRNKYQRTAKIGLCGAARSVIGIRADGQVIPCSALWDIPAGSIKEKPLTEIWENSPVLKQFRTFHMHSLDSIPECKACEFKYFCNGSCRASAFYYSGSILGYSPDCRYFRDNYI